MVFTALVQKTDVTFRCPVGSRGRLVSRWMLSEPGMHPGWKDPENMVWEEMCYWVTRKL